MKIRVRLLEFAAVVVLGLGMASSVQAGPSLSFANDSIGNFEGKLTGGYYLNDFTKLPSGAASPSGYYGSSLSYTSGPFGYNISAPANLYFSSTPSQYLTTESSGPTTVMTIAISGANVNAVGLDVFTTNATPAPDGGTLTLTVTTLLGGAYSETITQSTNIGNDFVDFFDTIANDHITSVTISPSGLFDSASVANLIVGFVTPSAAVPEPSSLLMLGFGALALGYGYRRKAGRERLAIALI